MRTITRATLALTGAAALTLFAVVPANAVDSTVTVQVVGVPATITTGAVSASGEILPNAAASVTISDVFVNDADAGVSCRVHGTGQETFRVADGHGRYSRSRDAVHG